MPAKNNNLLLAAIPKGREVVVIGGDDNTKLSMTPQAARNLAKYLSQYADIAETEAGEDEEKDSDKPVFFSKN
jgi:hypothetical protein